MNDAEATPTDGPREGLEFALHHWTAGLAELVESGRALERELRTAGPLERTAVGFDAAAAAAKAKASCGEYERVFLRYAKRTDSSRDLVAAPAARRHWYAEPKVIGAAVTAVLAAAAAALKLLITKGSP